MKTWSITNIFTKFNILNAELVDLENFGLVIKISETYLAS